MWNWTRLYGAVAGTSDFAEIGGIHARADGDIVLAGEAPGSGATNRWFARADAFGHTSCAASGACLGHNAKACDDANPCTLDDCSAAAGCGHKLVAAGATCGPGKACVQGACK